MRSVLGVVAGFLAWLVVWVLGELALSAIWPHWYGAHQRAFTAAIKGGGAFTPDTGILAIHIVLAGAIALLAGFTAALLARESKRAPFIAGMLLLAVAILKAAMSWPLVPVSYHVAFTAILLPMAVLGGRLRAAG